MRSKRLLVYMKNKCYATLMVQMKTFWFSEEASGLWTYWGGREQI